MIIGNNKPYKAISFQTLVLNDLGTYMELEGHTLEVVSAEEFMQNPDPKFQYINLVNRDMGLRKIVSEKLTQHNLDRFSFIHPSAVTTGATVNSGSMIYPMCAFMPRAKIERDVLMFSGTCIAHQTTVGQGTVVATGVNVSGSTNIGQYCFIGTGSIVLDKVTLADDVVVSAGSVIKKSIVESGYYVNNVKKNYVIPNYRVDSVK